MTRRQRIEILSGLMLGAGVLLSAFVARLGADAAWALAAPVLLALTVVATDMTVSRLDGGPLRPTPASLFLAASFLIAGFMVGLHDPQAVGGLIPILGGACGVPLLLGRRRGQRACPPG
ncbi:MAG TPA: hypothetical protein VGM16_03595 [Gammaproteobacteria bacterium]|jgi:hypothetical protein